jgi:hypothetical protein
MYIFKKRDFLCTLAKSAKEELAYMTYKGAKCFFSPDYKKNI